MRQERIHAITVYKTDSFDCYALYTSENNTIVLSNQKGELIFLDPNKMYTILDKIFMENKENA